MARDIAVNQDGSSVPTEDSHDGSEAGSCCDAAAGGTSSGTVKKRKTMPKPIAKACNECARRKARCPGGLPCAACTKHGALCEYTTAQRRGPKVKKRAAVEPADQSASDINTTSHEQALNLLADLSRNVPVNQRKDQTDGSTAEGLSNAQSIGAAEHAGTTRAPFKVQQQTAERPYLIGQPTISPYQNSAALPGANHSAEVPFQQDGHTDEISSTLNNGIFQTFSLPLPRPSHNPVATQNQLPVPGSALDNSVSFTTVPSQPEPQRLRLDQQHLQTSAPTQQYTDYSQHASDLYSTLSQPFTFAFAPVPISGQPVSSKHSIQSASQIIQGMPGEKAHEHRRHLPGLASSSPSGASESAFAQSFYKAEGPGLNHFQTVLSREFNVPEGGSPAAASLSVQANDPSSIRSEVGFSPAGSDVSLPAHMERDLVALADLTTTQQTLFGLYWCFVHVQWPIVYRPAFGFEQAKAHPALFNAMLSVTCRHDVSRQLQHVPGTLKNLPLTSRLGEIYTKRAIASLNMQEMESSLQKVQALFMLALRDVAQGTTSRGWMFSGMATRMAFDLQLHQPSKVFKSTRINPIAQQEQRRTIWCCYMLDKSMSLFLGRPSMIKFNDIETPLPSHWEADEFSYWAEDAKAVIPDRMEQFVGVQARPISTALAYIKLCHIIEKIMNTVYKPKAGATRAPAVSAVELNNVLDEWQDEHTEIFRRAENLANSTTNLYHLLLWYHTTRLVLNRPFIPNNQVIPTTKGDKSAYNFCSEAADSIVAVVTTLEQTHGIFRCSYNVLFTIFQAGVMHCLISSTATDPLIVATANVSLKQCDQWLESMTETYKCGAQYRHVLGAMERLSRRELRDSVELTEILASRRGSRQATPMFADPPDDTNLLVGDALDNPLSSLHYSFWDMPLHFPLQNNEMDSWMSWEQDYGSLLLEGLT